MKNKRERGQSLVEFLFMLPVLIGMAILLIRISTAIQISIVDQQVARAQAFVLTDNSSIYPRLGLQMSMQQKGLNQMILGVSDNVASGNYTPQASVQVVTRTPAQSVLGSDDPQSEPPLRAKVRVRNSVTLCSPTFLVGPSVSDALLPLSTPGGQAPAQGSDFQVVASGRGYPLDSSSGLFNYICGGEISYE